MDTPKMLDEMRAVKTVMQLYIDGAAGNADLLESAFHRDGRMFGHIGDKRRDVPLADFANGVRKAKRKLTGEKYSFELADIRVTGRAAIVTLVEEDYRGCDFVNYFTLAKFDDGWQIVSKTFTCTGGKFV